MKMVGVVAVMGVLAGPAWAQQQAIQKYGDPDREKTQADLTREKDAERAYKRSLGNIPEQQKTDPWGTMRSDGAAPKAAAKTPAKPKADTKSADTKPGGSAK
jgi:hypothetical protein